jgi:hypothetical protein
MRWDVRKYKKEKCKSWNMCIPPEERKYVVIRPPGAKFYAVCRKGKFTKQYWNWEIWPGAKTELISVHFELRAAQTACLLLQSTHNSGLRK